MKRLIIGIIGGLLFFAGSFANANGLGLVDDTYVSFQLKIPLNKKRGNLFSSANEYSFALINQSDGVKTGLVFTRDFSGNQTMGLVRSDFTLPLVIRNQDGISHFGGNSVAEFAMVLVFGAIVVVKVMEEVIEDISESIDLDDD
jgi:hypothetical protein